MSSQLPNSTSRLSRNSSGQSFVYPIKSLLTGKIQPSIDHADQRSSPDPANLIPLLARSNSGGNQSTTGKDGQQPMFEIEDSNTSSSPIQSHSPPAARPTINASPKFLAEQPNTSDRSRSFSALISNSGPASPPLSNIATTVEAECLVTSNPTPTNASEGSSPQLGFVNPDLPFNPSEYGIVHLPPPPSPTVNRLASSDLGCSLGGSTKSTYKSKPSSDWPTHPPRAVGSSFLSSESLNSTSSSSCSTSELRSEFAGSARSAEPPITFRFQYAEDEHGNYVVIGREGKLEHCEDEPISTPGAVQAFGVLIVVEELEDALVVRQVSENSTELLGLSPRFLFSLECFTDTLPDSEAVLLWDNIHFLDEPNTHNETDNNSPHVFPLSGWGASDSFVQDPNQERPSWTCWCAVHRTPPSNEGGPVRRNLITMEFELEKDTSNPLYPPTDSAPPVVEILSADGLDHGVVNNINYTESNTDEISSPSTPRRKSSDAITILSTGSALASTMAGSDTTPDSRDEQEDWQSSAEDILESTTSYAKPIPALERLRKSTIRKAETASPDHSTADSRTSPEPRAQSRRFSRGEGHARVGMMDVFAMMGQVNEQLGAATDLDMFLKVVVGVIKDLTQFHRVMVYQFDEVWNGQVVAELVDRSQTKDLYRGLHFPSSDIPAQARALYSTNRVRLLYDRSQVTARIAARSKKDLEVPLDMTHCYLRAMSPIHIKYLANMGVRASMSISILAFGHLWGLVTCHSYGDHGMRVSFPVRQMLRLLSQSISRNIERLTYAKRLYTRKLINTVASDRHPASTDQTGYIVNNAEDLLSLFDADFGILVIGEGAKILGPNQHGQEILIMAEYLRLKQFNTIQASQAVTKDFSDLELTAGFEIIAGLLYVPLSSGGKDFIALLRQGQPRHVRWAGKPYKDASTDRQATLEPRKSFQTWSETVIGRCRVWTDEQLETAGVLSLIFGKFIEVWRQKESALQTTRMTNLLLSNASHEVRTPLNHIINYLEMALDGALDGETRDNLSRSHVASKGLLFTINDLLDLTRLERGNATSFYEPFDLQNVIYEATQIYRREAERRHVSFFLEFEDSPKIVVGDAKKIRTVVQNLTGNSLKYTEKGSITVRCSTLREPEGLRDRQHTAVEIVVTDTGCGIQPDKLEHIFREFEQVESSEQRLVGEAGVGLGLAVVARIVEQLGGQLRVESEVDEGSRFSFLIPLALPKDDNVKPAIPSSRYSRKPHDRSITSRSRRSSQSSDSEIKCLVEALTSSHMFDPPNNSSSRAGRNLFRDPLPPRPGSAPGILEWSGSQQHPGPVKFDSHIPTTKRIQPRIQPLGPSHDVDTDPHKLRILIVEDDKINRTILAKRLRLDGHTVVNTTNGQEGFDTIASDRFFDAVLMDIQMPILNGFEATQKIRDFEISENSTGKNTTSWRLSHQINGRIPIFAVSASLTEPQRYELLKYGMDGWILKPINFRRLHVILTGVTDPIQRRRDIYRPGYNWEVGGWLRD